MHDVNVVIIGAGIGGASLAHALLQAAPQLKLVVLEAESQPGYHTTGRSAAFYAQTYGGPYVQPLTTASQGFLGNPPPEFHSRGFLLPRGALYLCNREDPASVQALENLAEQFVAENLQHARLDAAALAARAGFLRPAWRTTAIWDPDCADIDVTGLHQAYLRAMARAGGMLVCDSRVTGMKLSNSRWTVRTVSGSEFRARRVVNAAGAWADEIAELAGASPIAVAPMRRTMVVADTDPPPPAELPIVMDAGGTIYLKPDGGLLWISPHDENPDVPCDVQPDELDIAITMDRFERLCDWPIRRITRTWAGLRSFAPDRLPVLGADPVMPGFYWCAGQGGWGIQTAPAASAVAASTILGSELTGAYADLDPALYDPARFRQLFHRLGDFG